MAVHVLSYRVINVGGHALVEVSRASAIATASMSESSKPNAVAPSLAEWVAPTLPAGTKALTTVSLLRGALHMLTITNLVRLGN